MKFKKRHFIIPDTQVKDGVPIDHFKWLALAINEYKPDRVIHLGDHWDCHSVNSHAQNKEKEGERILRDIEAGNRALSVINNLQTHKPASMHMLRGNHEHRLVRYVNEHPVLDGLVGDHLFNDTQLGWKAVPYLNASPQAINLDGIWYAHFFSYHNTGKAIGGNAQYKLAHIGEPFVQGHVQGYDIGSRQYATGRVVRGIVAGSCYLHDEGYKGMANSHWRGALILNEVEKGSFSEMPLTMDYLCRKYEGMPLTRFMQRKYRNAKERFSVARTA